MGKLLSIGLAMFCVGVLHAADRSIKKQAESLLEASGIQGGLVVHIVLNTYTGIERTEEIVCHDGRLYLLVGTSEGKRSGEGLSRRGEPKPTSTDRVDNRDSAVGRRR